MALIALWPWGFYLSKNWFIHCIKGKGEVAYWNSCLAKQLWLAGKSAACLRMILPTTGLRHLHFVVKNPTKYPTLCLHETVKMINPIARAGHVTAEGSMIQASSWPAMSLQLASSSWRPACPLCPLPALGFLTNLLKVNSNCYTGSFWVFYYWLS